MLGVQGPAGPARWWVALVLCAGPCLANAQDYAFNYEIWGRASFGDGYIYGPPIRSTGVTVGDYDVDGDNDIILPGVRTNVQIMRNLGNSAAFYPGGPRDLDVPLPSTDAFFNVWMDMADVNGNGRPDLVVVLDNEPLGKSSIALYLNISGPPLDTPQFQISVYPYTSGQDGFGSIGPVNLADIDDDGLLDLFFVEYFLDDPSRSHRLFFKHNTGTAQAPAWAAPVEITELSSLMPPRYEFKSGDREKSLAWRQPGDGVTGAKAGFDPRVFDFQMADWDIDGDLDFMFYDTEYGVDWVLNIGTVQAPVWDTVINRNITPYEHPANLGRVFGAFAIKPGPFAPDFYVALQGRLQAWRYNKDTFQYELIQRSAVALEAGQGQPAFWDYDGDGDFDMFRGGITTGPQAQLLLFPNVGAPYAPIWNPEFIGLPVILLETGSASNGYRQDLMTFFDGDQDGEREFFVQRQDGRVSYYEVFEAPFPGGLPTFSLANDDMAGLSADYFSFDTGVQPRGMAWSDFNGFLDTSVQPAVFRFGEPDFMVNVHSDQGGYTLFLTQTHNPDTPYIDTFNVPFFDITGFLLDENDNPLLPSDIESMAAADIDRDGRKDLLISRSNDANYGTCSVLFYKNVLTDEVSGGFEFQFEEILPGPAGTDPFCARMISLVDIDSDTDADLFIGHQLYFPAEPSPGLNRYHYLQFYRNGGENFLDFVQARVPSGQSRSLIVNDVLPNYSYRTNQSGGSILNGIYTAGAKSNVVDIIQTTNMQEIAGDNDIRYFIDVIPPVGSESKAILIVGGTAADPLTPTFNQLAANAYLALLLQGLSKENIRLYAHGPIDGDGDGNSDIYSMQITPASLEQSITTWAAGTERLLVYMVDHGKLNRFRLNNVDYLPAATYKGWLDTLQNTANPPAVTTVIDTCEAGSFIDNLGLSKEAEKAGAKRITMTSSNVGPTEGVALFDRIRGISFSLAFFTELSYGASYGKAFDNAKVAIESINPLQRPQIDDSGDGQSNSPEDGFFADTHRPGAEFEQSASGAFIGDVAPPQTAATNTATLWLSDVVSNFPIDGAGALIVPPNFQREVSEDSDDEEPLSGFQWIDFTFNTTLNRWEASYSGFTEGGLYRIQYYVSSLGRYFASPRIGFVDRVGIPDAWENDDTSANANWLSINLTQGHNFDEQNDADWVKFFTVGGQSATVALLTEGINCKAIIELYRKADLDANAAAPPVTTFTATDFGKDIVGNYTFAQSEIYFARIRNADGTKFGAGTSYLFLIAVDTGGLIPTTLVAQVVQSGTKAAISDATVQASGAAGPFNSQTSSDGIAQFTCPNQGNYTVSANKAGYQTASQLIVVNNQIENVTLYMVPTGVVTIQATFQSNRSGVSITADGSVYPLPQTFTWESGSQHTISVPAALAGGYSWDKWSDNNTNTSRQVSYSANTTLTANYTAQAPGDINADGDTDAVDVQLVINGALGVPVAYNTDVNGDGDTDAVDVQLTINAALGL
jgi:hypothetical protein